MNYIQINTSQNVNLNFQVASIGKRALAFLLDSLFKGAYVGIITYTLLSSAQARHFFSRLDLFEVLAMIFIIYFPVTIYTLFFESIMSGQTPAKRIVGIKVIKIDGYQAKFTDYLVRWLFALIDIYISSAIIGVLFLMFNDKTQRLGGIASGTAVIDLKNNITINHTILENLQSDYKPQFPQVVLFSDEDMQIIKTHYTEALSRKDYKVIEKLAVKIKEIIKIEHTELQNNDLISRVIKDYNYLTEKETH